jgi:hypothetical protein
MLMDFTASGVAVASAEARAPPVSSPACCDLLDHRVGQALGPQLVDVAAELRDRVGLGLQGLDELPDDVRLLGDVAVGVDLVLGEADPGDGAAAVDALAELLGVVVAGLDEVVVRLLLIP